MQDTWRANDKFTLNYGLRLDVINPQTINAAGNAGYLDLTTGEIRVAGVGGNSLNGDIENKLNWAPRVGAAYQFNEKTVIRGAFGRSFDMGVFGSLFGHSVTQNLPVLNVQEVNGDRRDFDAVFNLAQAAPPADFPNADSGAFPLPVGVFARALPTQQRPPTVDAFNVIVQRQLSDTMSVEAGYVGNRGRDGVRGRRARRQYQPGDAQRLPAGRPSDQPQPFFNKFGWTQDIDYFCNCAKSVRLIAGEVQQAVRRRLFGEGQLHTAAGAHA